MTQRLLMGGLFSVSEVCTVLLRTFYGSLLSFLYIPLPVIESSRDPIKTLKKIILEKCRIKRKPVQHLSYPIRDTSWDTSDSFDDSRLTAAAAS